MAALAGLLAAADYIVFVTTTQGQRVDDQVRHHLAAGERGDPTLIGLLQYVTVGSIVLVVGTCAVIALARRKRLVPGAAVAVVVGANATTQLLKQMVLPRPELGWGTSNSLPSGHTTVVTSLVLAALLVMPAAGRWLVSLAGAVGVAVTGIGTVVANWHRPSDVVAGVAVAMTWGCMALAVISLRGHGRPQGPPRSRPVALTLGVSVAAGVLVFIGVRPDGTAGDLVVHLVTMGALALVSAIAVGTFARMVDVRVA